MKMAMIYNDNENNRYGGNEDGYGRIDDEKIRDDG